MEPARRALGLSCAIAMFLTGWHKFHRLTLTVDFGPWREMEPGEDLLYFCYQTGIKGLCLLSSMSPFA